MSTIVPLHDILVKHNGLAVTELLEIVECVVEQDVNLPSACSIRFHDDTFANAAANNPVLSKFQIGDDLTVSMMAGDESAESSIVFVGVVTGIECDFNSMGVSSVVVQGLSKVHLLHQSAPQKSYSNIKDSDIATQVIQPHGLIADTDSTGVLRKVELQANETDWEFLKRLAFRNNFRLYASPNGKVHFKRVSDVTSANASLTWGEDLLSFRSRQTGNGQFGEVETKSWDRVHKKAIVSKPESVTGLPEVGDSIERSAKKGLTGAYTLIHSITPFQSPDDGQAIATAMLNEMRHNYLQLEVLAYGSSKLIVGEGVELKGLGDQLSGKYYISRATHTYNAEGYTTNIAVDGLRGGGITESLGGSTQFASNKGFWNVTVGLVTNNMDPLNLGRVKVMYPALGDNIEGDWAKVVSPMAGKDRGIHFLPEVDDEVIVAFEHGDINYPYVLGSVWSSKDSPVEKNDKAVTNNAVNLRTIKSRIGHTILMDDTDGKGKIELDTKAKFTIEMSDKDQKIEIRTPNGLVVVLDDPGKKIHLHDKMGNSILLDSGANSIKIDCLKDFSVDAKGKVDIQAVAGVSIDSKATMKLSALASMEVSGTASTKVESTGIVTVQGTLVKIN